jgi:hypothetical protein
MIQRYIHIRLVCLIRPQPSRRRAPLSLCLLPPPRALPAALSLFHCLVPRLPPVCLHPHTLLTMLIRHRTLGCSTGTDTGTGDPVPGSPDPVVNNARWRPLKSQGENKAPLSIYKYIYVCGSRIRPLAQPMPACHLGAMDHPVATSERCESLRWPLSPRFGAGRTQSAADPGM